MVCDVSTTAQFSVSTAVLILLGAVAACALAIAITCGGSSRRSDEAATSASAEPSLAAPADSAEAGSAPPADAGREFTVDTE